VRAAEVVRPYGLGKEESEMRAKKAISPELRTVRLVEHYKKLGYTDEWIALRMKSIKVRNYYEKSLAAYGVTSKNYYKKFTDEMLKMWSGMNVSGYQKYKGIKKSLRDNMTRRELELVILSEENAAEMTRKFKPRDYAGHLEIAIESGRQALSGMGSNVVSRINATNIEKGQKKKDDGRNI